MNEQDHNRNNEETKQEEEVTDKDEEQVEAQHKNQEEEQSSTEKVHDATEHDDNVEQPSNATEQTNDDAFYTPTKQTTSKKEQTMSAQQAQQSTTSSSVNKQSKQSKGIFGGFFKLLAAGVIGSMLTLGVVTQTDFFQPEEEGAQMEASPESAAETTAEPVSTSDSVADIAENASEAIVGIVNMSEQSQNPFQQSNEGEEVKKGVGSGVIYKVTDDEAYIVTNNHVIEGSSSIKVSLEDDETVDGEVIGADPLTDIAIVKIEGDYDVTPIEFGDSESLRSGDQVIAIGNPIGLDFSRTVTQGIVSAKDRTISVNTSAGEWDFDVIQTDAAINPGNSGGALINMQGKLVGINSLKIANSGVEGLGFAIPSNQVQDLIDELAENGEVERPYMGVGLKSVSDIPRYYLQDLPEDLKEGTVVLSVEEGSAADEAGLQTEDVIVSIDGEEVDNDKDLRSYLYKEVNIGDKVTLELYRGGQKEKVDLTLASNEDAE